MKQEVQVLDKQFTLMISHEQIMDRAKAMADQISQDYEGKNPLFICILNGSFMFASDLLKFVTIPAEICFIKLASYKGTASTGHVITAIGLDTPVTHRHIIILEDIVDTGKTLATFMPEVENRNPSSIAICTLLHKPEATLVKLPLSYIGFSIENKFVVGYGLDYDGYGRNIDAIYQLK